MADKTALVNKIDEGLSKYYLGLGSKDYIVNGKGKFKVFCNEGDLDDDIVREELTYEPDECTLIEFDMTDDNKQNNFPFASPIKDPNEMNTEILRILKIIAKAGRYKPKIKKYTLDVNICIGIGKHELEDATTKYLLQMPDIMHNAQKDQTLMHFLAVGIKQGFPFLTYMIDSYTKDKASIYAKNGESLSLFKWVQRNKFMSLLEKNKTSIKLQTAMVSYIHRIMTRLKFQPIFQIDDSLEEIVEYIVSTALFIQKMVNQLHSKPPFQVDLLICVKKVESTVGDDDDSEQILSKASILSDDELDDESKDDRMDPNKDYIGDVRDKLKQYPVHFCPKHNEVSEEKEKTIETIARNLTLTYNDFTTILSKKDKEYDMNKYPQNKRFSIIIDRRKRDVGDDNQMIEDEITYFQPPDDCNTMPNGYVPEIGFELIQKCLIPQKINNNERNIKAKDGLCGKLMTFSFRVEQKELIQCYIVWNGQTMRFHGDHMTQILPKLFKNSEENGKFSKGIRVKDMRDIFEGIVYDEIFESFYQEIRNVS